MFGLLLVGGASFFQEISDSIGKVEVELRKESIFTMGFLNALWAAILLLALIFLIPVNFFAPGFPSGFIFTTASFPTFIPRLFLEILQAHVTVRAIAQADRSTYGFLRILTIPLLLAADFLLLYPVNFMQMIGMSLIVLSLILLFINHGIQKQGAWLVFFTAINAVLTISLFKYDITHFNSVEAEQVIVLLVLVLYFFVMAFFVAKENPLRLLSRPTFFIESILMGIGSVAMSFAFLFGPASVMTTATRGFSIIFAILSGNIYFHEKRFWKKMASFFLILAGLILLTV